MIELLAPAGNRESFLTALNNGANAIYLGYKNFNARAKVDNFSFEELSGLIKLAHLHDVKVYMTLNTLVKDDEINEILDTVYNANTVGIDAFIVQDIGLCSLIKKVYPGIVLHASTQMGVHNLQGAIIAEKLGVTRVVLSRETTLEDIKLIKNNTNLELEYFVQGALCVGFSGNCYMSGLLYGESGNRGRCLQLCRLPYSIKYDGKIIGKKYYLSTKDICMASDIQKLIDAGITSFKIEGRARRSGYVARVVNTYRQILDGKPFTKKMEENLKLAFNRGDYCHSYLNGNDKILFTNTQNNIGLDVGVVTEFQRGNKFNVVVISSSREIGKNDVLKFFRNNIEVASISAIDVKNVQGKYVITTTNEVKVGDKVSMLVDFDDEETYLKNQRRVGLKAEFISYVGKRAKLVFTAPYDIKVEVESNTIVQKAQNCPLSKEDIKVQISKMGNEVFEVKESNIVIDDIFMAKSEINDMRRRALNILIVKMLEAYTERNNLKKIMPYKFVGETISKMKTFDDGRQIIVQMNGYENLTQEIIELATYVVIRADEYTDKYFKQLGAYINKNKLKDKIAIYVPTILTSKDFDRLTKLLQYLPNVSLYINNIGGLYMAFNGFEIIAGISMNICNRHTVRYLELYNIAHVVLSSELSNIECQELSSQVYEICYYMTYGYLPFMSFAHCPFKEHIGGSCANCKYGKMSLISERDEFEFRRTNIISCHFEIENTKPIVNENKLINLDKVDCFISFKNESANQMIEVIKKNM